MRQLPYISLVLSIAVFMGADDAKKAKESDYDKLQGVWVSGEAWADGEKLKDTGDNDQAIRFVNRKARFGEIVRGKFADMPSLHITGGPLELDESQSPKHMTITLDGERILYVYSLKGDTLRMCFRGVGSSTNERPKTLPEKSKKGDHLQICTLTRLRPKKP